ncbi:hypothetical protein LDENG_00116540 [Lucifuga dentata]|nr:hypothetical protein LDENG_00116540 [Lucifuga dentata]
MCEDAQSWVNHMQIKRGDSHRQSDVKMAVHSPLNGTTAIPWRSSRKRLSPLSVLEQLRGCQEAWCPPPPWDRDLAHAAICGRPAGSFLVVQDSDSFQASLLCVSAGDNETVADYHIKFTGTVFQLSESRLTFSDLAQLVFFYSLSRKNYQAVTDFNRDVLAVCLSIPWWIYNVKEQTKDRLSQLGPEAWLCAPPDLQADQMTQTEPKTMMCTIQLTSANGALCVINPLYIHEHGDDWPTRQPTSLHCATQSTRRERRLSTTRTWVGAGLQIKRAISLDQEPSVASTECSAHDLISAQSVDSPQCPPTPSTPTTSGEVVLRRPSRDFASNPPSRAGSQRSLPPSTPTTPGNFTSTVVELQQHCSPVPQSPHRVSWIEDGVWLPPPRPSSLLQPPSLELDSLSISSIEEEQESQMPSACPYHPSAQRLANKVMNRLSAMGQAIGRLMSPKKRLTNRVLELSERRGGTFAEAVKGFVETTLKRGADCGEITVTELLQEVRSSLTSLRETLLDCPDIQVMLDSMTDLQDSELDYLVEISLHKVALKPVSTHLYSYLQTSRSNDGSLLCLQSNQHVLGEQGVEELGGSEGVGVPDPDTLERMQQKLGSMHVAYSPNKKVQILLKVCKSIYHSMSANANPGMVFGADDFLPCLTWVLLRSDIVTLQLDTEYMMELLDPTQLQGEGGYYLTSLYAALYYISSFRPRLAVRQLSIEAQQSLNQWHRRRTLHYNQSRRSKHRRTIRRQALREKAAKNSETEAGGKEEHESGKENDSVNAAESQQQTESSKNALEAVREEAGGDQEAEDQSEVSAPASQHSEAARGKSGQTGEWREFMCSKTGEKEGEKGGREELR